MSIRSEYSKLTLEEIEATIMRLGGVRGARRILAEMHPVIDCDQEPFAPEKLEIVEHKRAGKLKWDASKIALYCTDQQIRKGRKGYELQQELSTKMHLNANVLDYLITNPDLIPKEWEKYSGRILFQIHFWGTQYRHTEGDRASLCVRHLSRRDGQWNYGHRWIDNEYDSFGGDDPAAVIIA